MTTKTYRLSVLGLVALAFMLGASTAHAHKAVNASSGSFSSTPAPAPVDLAGPVADRLPAAGVEESVVVLAAAPETSLPLWPLGLMAGLLIAAALRPRHALAIALVVVLAVLAFEAGVHSVHHLGDAQAGCAIAAVSVHLSGLSVDPPDARLLVTATSDRLALPPPIPVRATPLAAHESRGPPASSRSLV
jgi:hypothetical protein